jgi:phosphoribosyl 1,2-cyclic phosphodiesterase
LIDVGIGPKVLAERLETVGSSWSRIGAVVLTHTHGDHVDTSTFAELARRGISLYCHEGHCDYLTADAGFRRVEAAGLIKFYDDHPFLATTGLRVEPITLRHDGGPTFGFRIESSARRRARPVSVGYIADTGCWSAEMVEALIDVDLLGVEFNHDVQMQKTSRRPEFLIQRNLGDGGHLSNSQGAELLCAVLTKSRPGTVRHAVLLHLSQQCNRPALAIKAAREAVKSTGRQSQIHAAEQAVPSPSLQVTSARTRLASGADPAEPPTEKQSTTAPTPERLRDVAGQFGWDLEPDPADVGAI